MSPAIAAGCGFAYHVAMAVCFKCGHVLPARELIFRATTCEECTSDVRVCRNCGFYEPGAHWDCRETVPEAVREKDRANFCEYFQIDQRRGETNRLSAEVSGQNGGDADARDSFNSLFSDK